MTDGPVDQPTPPDMPVDAEPASYADLQADERAAHVALVNSLIPAAARRLETIIRTAIDTCGAGDYAIWLPLFAMDACLRQLTFTHGADGKILPNAEQLHNDAKIHLLAAHALRKYSARLLERATAAVSAAHTGSVDALIDVRWTREDSEATYEEAAVDFQQMISLEPPK